MPSIHRTTMELVLGAISDDAGDDGLKSSFLFSMDPDLPHWRSNLGVTVFFSQRSMIKAALFVQSHGPTYIRSLSIDAISVMLREFLEEHFSYVARDTFSNHFPGKYSERVSDQTKVVLARELARSSIFVPENTLTIFPMVTISVEHHFTSRHYFFCSPEGLNRELLPRFRSRVVADIFPPLLNAKTHTEESTSWLGVRSPILQTSVKMKTAILGALALSLPLNARYAFTGRKTFGGYCILSDSVSFAFGDSHTPPISRNVVIRRRDRAWLNVLSEKLLSSRRNDRRQMRALEYFYRAWTHGRTERFPFLCMALDALYSEARKATQSVIDGIRDTLGTQIEDRRLRMLMDLRASVIHGGAPDVSDSSKYRKYYQEFLSDPIDDLDDVFAEAARRRIFSTAYEMQTDENAAMITKLQESGHLPRRLGRHGILDDTSGSEQ